MTQKKPKLGVLALMLEDYLPLFPGIDRAQTAYVNEVLDGLRDAAEFVFPHAAMNRAQIESLVAQYNHEKLDGILILLLTYSQGAYLVRALEENHLPLALALIQPEQTVRPDFIEWDYTVNQGIHGSQDQANVMTRMGVNCVYYAGNRCDGSFAQFVADFGRAAMTVRAMKRMRIGVIGKLPGMGDVITDDMAIYRCLGPELVYDSIGTVRRFCAEVEEDAVRAQMDADRAVFELDPTLDEPTHAEAARMYLGLRAYLQSGIDDTYELFLQAVERGRNVSREKALAMADGKMFTGTEALKTGLVDRVCSREAFITHIKEGLDMTLAELREQHPEAVAALRAELEQEVPPTRPGPKAHPRSLNACCLWPRASWVNRARKRSAIWPPAASGPNRPRPCRRRSRRWSARKPKRTACRTSSTRCAPPMTTRRPPLWPGWNRMPPSPDSRRW